MRRLNSASSESGDNLARKASKKRKRQNNGKNDRKKVKPDLESPEGEADAKTRDDACAKMDVTPKTRTLYDMFSTAMSKQSQSTNVKNAVSESEKTSKMKQPTIIDLTSPNPPSKVSTRTEARNCSVKKRKKEEKLTFSSDSPALSSKKNGKRLKVKLKKLKRRGFHSETSTMESGKRTAAKKSKTNCKIDSSDVIFIADDGKEANSSVIEILDSCREETALKKSHEKKTTPSSSQKKQKDKLHHKVLMPGKVRAVGQPNPAKNFFDISKPSRKARTKMCKNVREAENPVKSSSSPANLSFLGSKNEAYDLSPLPCDTILWTEKYEPKCSSDIIGNSASVEKLLLWLEEWKRRWEKEKEEQDHQGKGSKTQPDDSDSDFELDNEDKKDFKDENDTFLKAAVLIGPIGSCKTSTIYACAREMNFQVFEMNASSQRSSKQILSTLHEATQSHQVSKVKNARNFFKVKERATKSIENSSKTAGDSLILFKDVEVLFDDDKFFWSAIDTLVADTKRPIVFTTSDSSTLVNLKQKCERFLFSSPRIDKQLASLKSIAEKEYCDLTEDSVDVKTLNRLLGCDLRKTIHALHFWGSGNTVTKAASKQSTTLEKNSELKKVSRKRRRSARKNSKLKEDTKPPATEAPQPTPYPTPVTDLFAKASGIYDILQTRRTSSAESAGEVVQKTVIKELCSLLTSSGSHDNREPYITAAEQAAAVHVAAGYPQILKLNWSSLMPCFLVISPCSVGKSPLEIRVPQTMADPGSDMEFTFEYSADEAASVVQEPTDFLFDEEFVDVHDDFQADSFSSLPPSGTKTPQEVKATISNSAKTQTDLRTLDSLSSAADMWCASDRLERLFATGQWSLEVLKQTLDVSRCKVKDGLKDVWPKVEEFTDPSIATYGDIQASLQARSVAYYWSEMAGFLSGQNGCKFAVPDELALRLPYEGGTRRNFQYLRRSMQSKFAGGYFSTTKDFTSDYLPTLRAICRSENCRKESKKRRRFLHYFNTIRVFPRLSEMSLLLSDYKETK